MRRRSAIPKACAAHGFGLLEPLFDGFGTRLLTEFPQPDQPDAEVSIPTPQPRRGLVSDEEQKALQSERRRNALRSQLDAAVREERYEDAARLRDELRSLPQE